jgi:hypothetical protein
LAAIPGKHSIDSLQKTAVLGTSHIIWEVLQRETGTVSGGFTVGSNSRKKRPVTRDDNNDDNNNNNNKNKMMMMMKIIMPKGSPMPYFKYEPQSILENSNYKLYYDKYIMTIKLSITIDGT